MNEQDSGFEPIADDSLDAIDAACDRFQAALREGEPATIEQFVDTVSEDARRHLVPELVEIDIHFRRQQGEPPTAVKYLLRFPEFADSINELLASHLRADIVGDKETSRLSGSLHRGTRLGTYEIMGFLGRGGMGTVYRARHTKLDRVVALKVLPPGLLSNADTIARFEGEIRALGSLDHPNVVRATDADDDDGYHYFAMDYVPGIDLARLSKQAGPLPVADACELIRQAAEGLEYLNQRGIVHRDIKPANLMLCPGLKEHGDADCTQQTACCTESPLVKILDLGLARLRQWRDEHDPITSTGQLLGTLDFMAPEQLDDSREVDIRADIYGLGATLYKLLTGKTPYVGGSHLHTLRALATESPPSVGSHLPDLPAPLVAAVDRMLAREPAARVDTPAQVAEALAPFVEGADPCALVRQIKRPCSDDSPSSESSDAEQVAPTLAADPTKSFDDDRIRVASADSAGAVRAAAGRRRPLAFAFIALITIVIAVAVVNHLIKAPDGELPKPGSVADKDAARDTKDPEITLDDPAITQSDLPLVKTFQGTTGPVQSLAFTADGSALVSSDRGGAVRIWDVESAVQRNSRADLEPVIAVAVSPDQRLIAAGTIGQGITVIQMSDADTVRTMADDMRHVLDLDWSPDGRWLLASDYGGSAIAWDMEQEGEAKRLVEPGGRVESVRFSRNGATALVAGVQHGLSVWNVPQWSLRVEIADGYSVADISPSGDRVATRGIVFDTATGETVTSYEASRFPVGTTFTPDGRHIISCETAFALAIVEVATAQVVARIEMSTSCMDAVAVSPDGKYMVTAGGLAYDSQTKDFVDSGDYTIRMWRLPETVWPQERGASNPPETRPLPLGPVPTKQGMGRFYDSGQRLGGGCSRAVRLGDFDADGDLDAFVLNQFDEPNRVWMNDGQGTFADSGQRLGDSYSWDLALGDVDGDADLDAFVVNCNGQPSRVWLSDGKGNFSDSGQRIPSVDARDVALADLDDDGDLDAMLAGRGANTVLRNDGTGVFEDSGLRLGSGDSCCVALADFNGDGAVDAFVGNCGYGGGESNRVWLNDGQGSFAESGQPLGDASTVGIALADLDDDGDIDAFAANHGLRRNRIWLNDGTGRFAGIEHMGLLRSVRISLGDLDGDGDLDALIANAENKPNEILYGGGPGIYSRKHVHWLGISSSSDSALGDLDGDGDLDAFVTNLEGQPNRVWFYQEPGETPAADQPAWLVDSGQELGSSNSLHVSLADLDGDDDLDAFVANYKQPNRVWLNEGGGVFRDSGQSLGESRSTRVALGDLDGDGDLDAFVPNVGNQPNTVFLNEGGGVFRDSGQMLGNSGSKAAELRDFDSDGDLDAFVINYYHGQPNRIWLNDGQGQFTDSGQELGNSTSEGLAVGDFDGDGDDDAFVANLSDQSNRVYWNDGKGTFSDSGQQLGNSHSKAVCVADLDDDGDLDAFVSNEGPNRVWLNDGQGVFRDSGQQLGNLWSSFAVLDDIDDDGDVDAFVVNGGPNAIWLNDGQAGFEVGQLLDRSHTSIGLALADLDGDEDLDAFIGNHDGQPNRVWLNRSSSEPTVQPPIEGSNGTSQPAQAPTEAGDAKPVLLDQAG